MGAFRAGNAVAESDGLLESSARPSRIELRSGTGSLSRSRTIGCLVLLALAGAMLLGAVPARADIFWASATASGPAIGHASDDGTNVNPSFIVPPSPLFGISAIAVGGGYVYWALIEPGSSGGPSTIGRAKIDGSDVTPNLITGQHSVSGLAVDGSHIYWGDNQNNGSANIPSIGRANLDGTGVNENFITPPAGTALVDRVAVDPSHIYWENEPLSGTDSIADANLDASGINPSLVSNVAPGNLALDSSHLYFDTFANNHFVGNRANLDGTGATPILTGGDHLAAGGGYVFYDNGRNDGVFGNIGRVNADGTAPNPTFIPGGVSPYNGPLDIAVSPANRPSYKVSGMVSSQLCTAKSCTRTGLAGATVSVSGTATDGSTVSESNVSTTGGSWSVLVPAGAYTVTPAGNGWDPPSQPEAVQADVPGVNFVQCASSRSGAAADNAWRRVSRAIGPAAEIAPVGVRPALNKLTNYCDRGFSYYASTALHSVGAAIGAAFVPIGGALVYVGAFTELPSAGASTIAVVGGLALAGAGANIVRGATNAQDDPPDPHFTSLLAVPKVRALKLHAQRGLSARAAKALDNYATDLHKAAAVAGTLATTINRAGGSILAQDTAWEGRQIRYAIRLTQSFKTDIAAALKDARSLRRAAKSSPAFTARLSAAMLRATQRKYRNRSLPGGVAKLLRPYGVSAGQLKTALKVKLPKRLPRNVLQFLTAQSTIADLQNAVKAFTAWSQVPQIVSESKLT